MGLHIKAKITRRAVVCSAIALLSVAFVAALVWGPWYIEDQHIHDNNGALVPSAGIIITGIRTVLVAVAASAIAGIGLYYTHKSHRHAEKLYLHSQDQFAHARDKDREQAELTREGQVTDRYLEAIKLLGSENVTQRLGGIYSLGRIMRDSERDYWAGADVLAAFVRTYARKNSSGNGEGTHVHREDVLAALNVIGTAPRQPKGSSLSRYQTIDLSGTDLRGYDLYDLDLDMIKFDRADMAGCDLQGSTLRRSSLKDVTLREANLVGANLFRTRLINADLSRTNLTRAYMSQAHVHDAIFDKTNLKETIATKIYGLQYSQVDDSLHDESTQFPEGIRDWLKTRTEEEARAAEEENLP
ncbi:pentapeptide repeat-containing protein [Streptomyces sp. NBC_01334]|uniref:pentapeptide repeat-containing protein n=1 Tax=Streptomyces sp. NBC_01334 TaxID=2903827 RepID=UPI002E10621A|nr:pentapeptide repeat-containing protein [Streptomyces sp. NBC_01334]